MSEVRWCLFLFLIFTVPSLGAERLKSGPTLKQQTIGDVLKRMGQSSSTVKKGGSDLPKSIESAFEKKMPVNLEAVKPPRSSDIYRVDGDGKEAEYERLTDKGIQSLFALVNKFKNSPNRGELWVRLAEAYVEKAKLVKFRKYREYEEKLDEYELKKTKVKPVLDLSESREYNQKAVNLYKMFLRDFPKDKKVSQVLFFLGYNYYELGREDEGAKYYKILADRYTKSLYLDESIFALGDYYFEKNRWKDALKYYARLIEKKNSRHYLISLYKAAWCQYRIGNVHGALKGMELVFYESRRLQTQSSDSKSGGLGPKVSSVRLASEALRDLVPFYSEVGEYHQAENYFERLVGAGPPANRLLERLAYLYSNKGNIEGATTLFKRLISLEPLSAKTFDYQYTIVSLYSSAGKGSIFKRELYDWITNYAPNSQWAQANQKDEKLLAEAYERRERTLRNYVLQQHAAVKKSRAEESQKSTLEWYKLYLWAFNGAPQASDMHFYYGELLYDVKNFVEAAAQYSWVLEHDPNSKFYKDAMINLIVTLEKLIPTQQALLARRDKMGINNVAPMPLDPQLTRFVYAIKLFIEKYPQDPQTLELEYRLAQIYYLHNMYREAQPLFETTIAKSPKSQIGQDSISFILDMYSRSKDYVGLRKMAEKYLSQPEIVSSAVGNQLRQVLINTKFKNSEQLLASNNFYAAGESFEKFAAEHKESSLAIKASYNAAYSYKKAHAVGPALRMFEQILSSTDRSPEAQKLKLEAMKELPPLYQQLGRYVQAAKAYETYALANPNSEYAANYFFNAAVIWDGYGFWDNAIRNYENYERREKKGSDKIEAAYFMAEIYRKRGDLARAAKFYEKYLSGPATQKERIVEVHFKLFEIAQKMRNQANIVKWRDRTISIQRKFAETDRHLGAKYAAEARFSQLLETFNKIKVISLPENAKRQAQGIKQRLDLIENLKKEIVRVLMYASGHQIVASYTTLALAYEDTAHKIKTAPLPHEIKSLSKDQIAQYQAKVMETYVVPLEQKAIENFRLAISNANDLDVYDDYVIEARKKLAKYDPQSPFVNANIKLSSVLDTMGLQ